jgi:hypothetical protein
MKCRKRLIECKFTPHLPRSDETGTDGVQKCTLLNPCPFETHLTVIHTKSTASSSSAKTLESEMTSRHEIDGVSVRAFELDVPLDREDL